MTQTSRILRARRWAPVLALLAALSAACDDEPANGGSDAADTSDASDTGTADALEDTADTGNDVEPDSIPDVEPDAANDVEPDVEPLPVIVINEVVASPLGADPDWVELYNPGSAPVDLLDWSLTDDDPTHVATFTSSRTVSAGGYLLLEQDGVGSFDFGLGEADAVLLYDADGTLVDAVDWEDGDAPPGRSFGRIPNGTGPFVTLVNPTPGAENQDNPTSGCGNGLIDLDEACDGNEFGPYTCLALGMGTGDLTCLDDCTRLGTDSCSGAPEGVVINEVTASGTDRVELFNAGDAAVDLTGWELSDDDPTHQATLPAQFLDAADYLVLETGVHFEFGLSSNDAVFLRDDEGNPVDAVDWLGEAAEVSYCRIPNGSGAFQGCNPTFGTENAAP